MQYDRLQAQIMYYKEDGAKRLRVLSQTQKVTVNREEMEKVCGELNENEGVQPEKAHVHLAWICTNLNVLPCKMAFWTEYCTFGIFRMGFIFVRLAFWNIAK